MQTLFYDGIFRQQIVILIFFFLMKTCDKAVAADWPQKGQHAHDFSSV